MYHVTNVRIENPLRKPNWTEIRPSIADDPTYDQQLLYLPIACFTTTLFDGIFPKCSPYPRHIANPSASRYARKPKEPNLPLAYWRVSVPFDPMNSRYKFFKMAQHGRKVKFDGKRQQVHLLCLDTKGIEAAKACTLVRILNMVDPSLMVHRNELTRTYFPDGYANEYYEKYLCVNVCFIEPVPIITNMSHKSEDHKNEDNKHENHKNEDHKSEDHKSEDHKSEDCKNQDYKNEDHKNQDSKNEDQKNEDHKNEDSKNEDHKNEDGKNAEDHKNEDSNNEDHKNEDGKNAEDQKNENSKNEDHKNEDHKNENHKKEDSKNEGNKSEDHKNKDHKNEDSKNKDHKNEDSKNVDHKSEDCKNKDHKNEDHQNEDSKNEDHKNGEHKNEDHRNEGCNNEDGKNNDGNKGNKLARWGQASKATPEVHYQHGIHAGSNTVEVDTERDTLKAWGEEQLKKIKHSPKYDNLYREWQDLFSEDQAPVHV